MDLVKIGQFLARLRREKNMTQQELGERLGVSNKTVSRWENGNYLPTAEMLQQLSGLYSITINEILSASRLTEEAYREKAEDNIKTALQSSSFTRSEKEEYFKRKWKRDHAVSGLLGVCAVVMLFVLHVALDGRYLWIPVLASLFGSMIGLYRRNQMMGYVEEKAFDGSGLQ